MMVSTAFLLAASPLPAEIAEAPASPEPRSWVVEYPRAIQPYVEDYRRCLNIANRILAGRPDIERQHRADIPRCAEERTAAVAASNGVLNGAKTPMSAAEIDALFDRIGLIHIARGRDLDRQFMRSLSMAERRAENHDATRPRGLVIELRDASVVKSRLEIEGRGTNSSNETMEAGNAGY